MTTLKDLKKVTEAILRSSREGSVSLNDQVDELMRAVEGFTRRDMIVKRDRSLRVSSNGISIDDGGVSYASQEDGARAVRLIERLRGKI